MIFDKIKLGDKLQIKNELYEVARIEYDADVATEPPYKIDEFIGFELHKLGANTLRPTHELRYYEDKQTFFLFRIEQTDKNTFSYKDKLEIPPKDMKME